MARLVARIHICDDDGVCVPVKTIHPIYVEGVRVDIPYHQLTDLIQSMLDADDDLQSDE